jgi:hypothetical protein
MLGVVLRAGRVVSVPDMAGGIVGAVLGHGSGRHGERRSGRDRYDDFHGT